MVKRKRWAKAKNNNKKRPEGLRRDVEGLSVTNASKTDVARALDLAVRYHQAKNLEQAGNLYEQILDDYPNQADALHLLGMVSYQRGDFKSALALLEKAVAANPDNDDAWRNMGTVKLDAGDAAGAVACCRKSIELNAASFESFNNYGNALAGTGDHAAAEVAYRQSLSIEPRAFEVLNNLAVALCDQVRPEEAISACQKAVEINPRYPVVYNTWGNALDMLGRLDEAVEKYRQAISIHPDFAEPRWHIARSKKFSERDEDIEAMERLVDRRESTPAQRMHLSFSLAKAYEDIGAYDDAFCSLETANRLKRGTFEYDIETSEKNFQGIMSRFTEPLFERLHGSGLKDPTPIFIVGMPRSGTTLIEQILSSHPDVHGAGELDNLGKIVNKHFGGAAGNMPDGANHPITAEKITEAAQEYLDVLRSHSADARYITDKMPHNFENIGMIRLMFPNAKVVFCRRNPIDNCLSIYKMHFSSGALQYAYDQIEVARFYKLHDELMAHWERLWPGSIMENEYEYVVENQRAATEKLLDFCGLEWDDACIAFNKNKRAVKTASFAQVRVPIFRTSVELWRSYEDHLRGMIAELHK